MRTRILLSLLALSLPTLSFAQIVDTDGDGVPDSVDLCPTLDASGFDADGDGCPDDPRGARHVEYWAPEDLPLVYRIHEGASPSVNDGSDVAAIDAAFAAWTSLPGVALEAVNGGAIASASASGLDGVHQVTFSDPSFDFGRSVLAVGLTTSFTEPTNFLGRDVRPGQIVDADILFNPDREFRTSTGGLPNAPDIQSTATHEVGHLFGFSHSAVETATMFYVLPPIENARSLESDDRLIALKSYPDAGVLAGETRVEGSVTDVGGNPVPGAAVFLVSEATGDTTACEYTLPDGSFTFVGAPDGDYRVAIHPLDGSSSIRFLVPGFINALVEATANVVFVPEWWSVGDSSTDDPNGFDLVSLQGGQTVAGIDVVTNVDQLPPVVLDRIPGPGAMGVGIDAAVLVSFDEAIDDATLQGNFALRDADGNFVAGLASIFDDDRVVSFTPREALRFGVQYELTLGSGLADRFGNALGADSVLQFTTEARPDVVITSLTPRRGVAGTSVVINGDGFDGDVLANNQVFFDGIAAQVTAASPTRLIATVPSAVAIGSYQVTAVSAGNTSNDLGFSVLSLQEIARGTDVGVANLAGSPRALAEKQDGSLVYVGTSAGVSTVVVDPGQPSYLASDAIDALDDPITSIDITPDGRRVYAVSRVERRLHWIDADATSENFNEVLDTIDLNGEPLGLAIEPTGRRAFLAMADGSIQVWDVQFESATFNRQIFEITSQNGGAVGDPSFDPSGELMLFPTGGGSLAIHSLRTLERVAEIPVSVDPASVEVDPSGALAYVSDGGGSVAVVSLGDLAEAVADDVPPSVPAFKVQDIELGGSAGGIAITPAALFAYVTNREFDQVEVVDLDPTSSTFRTSAAEIATGANPIDTSISLDANYLYTLVEGENRLQVTAIGFGPVLRSVYPRVVRPGDLVAISGFNFSPVDCQTTDCPPGDGERIFFGDLEATEFQPVGDAFLNVRVPEGFTGGPVRVQTLGGGPPSAPDPFSNAIFVRAIEPGAPFDPSGFEGISPSIFMNEFTGYDFVDDQEQYLTNVAGVSPDGEVVVLGGFGTIWILDGRTTSATFNQVLAEMPLSLDQRVEDVAFSPDGRLLYVSMSPPFGDSVVDIVDVNPNSPGFATVTGQIDLSNITNCFSAGGLSTHPTGQFLFIEDDCNNAIVVADITPGSTTENTIIERPPFFAFIIGADFAPGGDHLYTVAGNDGSVYVVNSNPLSAGWPEWETQVPISGLFGMDPQDVAFLPDGNRALVLAKTPNPDDDKFDDYYLITLDSSVDRRNPTILYGPQLIAQLIEKHAPRGGSLVVTPQGHRAIVHLASHGMYSVDITGPNYVLVDTSGFAQGSNDAGAGLAITPDGTRAYVVERQSLNVGYAEAQLLNFRAFAFLEVLSGRNQTGVAGQALPAPIRVRAFDADAAATPLSGMAIEVKVAGGGSLPNGATTQVFSTDDRGIVEIGWTLGPDPDADPLSPANTMEVYLGQVSDTSPETVSAVAVQDPATLPLQFVQVLPIDQANGVSATTSVQAIFSRAIDRASANLQAFFVHPDGAVDPVPAIIGLADGDRRISLTPIAPLAFDTDYRVEITDGLQDTDANLLTNPSTTSFTTGAAPPLLLSSVSPPSAATGVELVLGGQGFDPDPAGNTVYFGEVAAVPTAAGLDFLRVRVPGAAVTGRIRVEANGQVSGTLPFRVLVPNTAPLDEVIASVAQGSTTKGVTLTPDGTRAYTLSPEANLVIPLDMDSFTTGNGIPVGENPVSIDVHPNGKLVYVANFGSNDVSVIDIDPASPNFEKVVDTIATGNSPIDLDVTPDGARLFVAHAAETFFGVVDSDRASATFHTVVASVATGTPTKAVVVDPDGSRVFFGTDVGYFLVQEPAFDTVVASVGSASATKALRITADGGLLIVLSASGAVNIYDVNEGSSAFNEVVASVGSSSSTRGINLSPDGGLLYLFQEGSDEILVFSLEILGSVSVVEEGVTAPARVALTLLKSLDLGPDPSALGFDPSGSGRAVLATAGNRTLSLLNTGSVPLDGVEAMLEVTPRVLNLQSNGRFVTASIELPLGFFPQQIDVSTVLLHGGDPGVGIFADPDRVSVEDEDGDGLDELVVKFARDEFQRILAPGDQVPVFVQGVLDDGRNFLGEDAIRTLRPTIVHPNGGEELLVGTKYPIAWQSPEGVGVDAVTVAVSLDDGETWTVLAEDIWDGGSIQWYVPWEITELGRVLVTVKSGGQEIGTAISAGTFSTVTKPVAVALQNVQLGVEAGNARLHWQVAGGAEALGFHVLRANGADGAFERITDAPVQGSVEGFDFEDDQILGNRTYYYFLEEAWSSGEGHRHGPFELTYAVSNRLDQNVPNSFNPKTSIGFAVGQRGPVQLSVYDLAGRRVKVLVNEVLEADEYRVEWNGRDARGAEVASGVYFYRIDMPGFVAAKKMTLVR